MKTIYEISKENRRCTTLPCLDLPIYELGENKKLNLPEVSEIDLVRHYTNLSREAFGVDNGFYPLGSCTMKYNPKVNEKLSGLDEFNNIHPYQNENSVQGSLKVIYELSKDLAEISGMDAISLQPAAGAHGEYTGLLTIKKYQESIGESHRNKILVPDSSHGTNPATANCLGYEIVSVPSDKDNLVDIEALQELVGDDTAGLMLTNPNTLGLFEKNIEQIVEIVHGAGGLLFYDGANLNAIMGISRPHDMGFDVQHFNLHKTFSTPHGGGGPGAGPIGVTEKLKDFLPNPTVIKNDNGTYSFKCSDKSLGRVKSFYGNFNVYLKAFIYIKTLGKEGIRKSAEIAVLNANYMMNKLREVIPCDYTCPCMHEFVLSYEKLKEETGVSSLDMAKGMIDNNIHPPTIYFPLIVAEAAMFEPTETESKETLDNAIEVIKDLYKSAYKGNTDFHSLPQTTKISRADEVNAAREPKLIIK